MLIEVLVDGTGPPLTAVLQVALLGGFGGTTIQLLDIGSCSLDGVVHHRLVDVEFFFGHIREAGESVGGVDVEQGGWQPVDELRFLGVHDDSDVGAANDAERLHRERNLGVRPLVWLRLVARLGH